MKLLGSSEIIVTGNTTKQETGRWQNKRVESSQLPFRRRERALLRLYWMRSLQKIVVVHVFVLTHFNQGHSLYQRGHLEKVGMRPT